MSNPDLSQEQIIQRSHHARRLLEDSLLKEAFEAIDAMFVREWRQGENAQKREAAWAKVHALGEVKRVLRKHIHDGEYALRKQS